MKKAPKIASSVPTLEAKMAETASINSSNSLTSNKRAVKDKLLEEIWKIYIQFGQDDLFLAWIIQYLNDKEFKEVYNTRFRDDLMSTPIEEMEEFVYGWKGTVV